MICNTVRIEYTTEKSPIQIVVVSDTHIGHVGCDYEALAKTLSRKNCYFIFNGDLLDSIVLSDRRYSKASDATEKEAILDEQVDKLYEKLEPIKKRILWIGRGNHEQVVLNRFGTDLIGRLCNRLDVLYAGYSCLMKIRLFQNKRGKIGAGRSLVIRAHHGWGGGCRTIGSVITKYSHDVKYWDADVYVYGHDHVLHSVGIPRGRIVQNRHIAYNQHIVLAGTYLRTYTRDTSASYSEIKGFPLAKIGSPTINIQPRSRGVMHVWIDT